MFLTWFTYVLTCSKVTTRVKLDSEWSRCGGDRRGQSIARSAWARRIPMSCLSVSHVSLSFSQHLSLRHLYLSFNDWQLTQAPLATISPSNAKPKLPLATVSPNNNCDISLAWQWDLSSSCEISGVVVLPWGLWCGGCYGVVVIL